MQCACTSMVLMRLPLTTTSRRPCACGCPPEPPPGPPAAPAVMSHPTKTMFAGKSPLIGISIPSIDELSDFSLLRQASNPICLRRSSQHRNQPPDKPPPQERRGGVGIDDAC